MTPGLLKRTRNKLRLTQFAVAKAAKVSRYKIAIYETGYGKLFEDEEYRINQVLKEHQNVKCRTSKS